MWGECGENVEECEDECEDECGDQCGDSFTVVNCTEWSAIWSEIKRVITKSHDREAGVRFVITSLISDQNCTTRSAISTLLHSF